MLALFAGAGAYFFGRKVGSEVNTIIKVALVGGAAYLVYRGVKKK